MGNNSVLELCWVCLLASGTSQVWWRPGFHLFLLVTWLPCFWRTVVWTWSVRGLHVEHLASTGGASLEGYRTIRKWRQAGRSGSVGVGFWRWCPDPGLSLFPAPARPVTWADSAFHFHAVNSDTASAWPFPPRWTETPRSYQPKQNSPCSKSLCKDCATVTQSNYWQTTFATQCF